MKWALFPFYRRGNRGPRDHLVQWQWAAELGLQPRLLEPALGHTVAPTGLGSLPAGPRYAPWSPGASPVAMDVGVWLRGGEASPVPREMGRALPVSPGGLGSAASKMVKG